ncbi:MAG: M28 family peptidase [Taibaiella sp.]|nr:M28 family peptidase [Taibaiella sp.]
MILFWNMNSKKYLLVMMCVLLHGVLYAQQEKRFLKHHISILTEPAMEGRGYVHKGNEKAAKYVVKNMKNYGLLSVMPDSAYLQSYYFAVNTFPDEVFVSINKKVLATGADYIVDAGSSSINIERGRVKMINLNKVKDTTQWNTMKASFGGNHIYWLKGVDSFNKRMHTGMRHLAKELPAGCYIVPVHGKMTWTVATEQIPATIIYTEDTVMPHYPRRGNVRIHAAMLPQNKNRNENVIACVPGAVKDSFVVFTAHYDHLGRMGSNTYFPGASDNASGTAMLLYLANYFSNSPQHYTMVFIAFSGEEAGLLGSDYFVQHPLIPLDHIRFLTNIDIMGDATDGVTVVNATEFPKEFSLLQRLNSASGYLPQIKSRGKAANSDHYHFTEAGVPSFFIYSNGGKGYYHDVFDTGASLPFTNIEAAAKLFVAFAKALNKPY